MSKQGEFEEGWIWKKSRWVGKWNRRFLKIDNYAMYFWKEKYVGNPSFVVLMKNIVSQSLNSKEGFDIRQKRKRPAVVYLRSERTEGATTAQEWLDIIAKFRPPEKPVSVAIPSAAMGRLMRENSLREAAAAAEMAPPITPKLAYQMVTVKDLDKQIFTVADDNVFYWINGPHEWTPVNLVAIDNQQRNKLRLKMEYRNTPFEVKVTDNGGVMVTVHTEDGLEFILPGGKYGGSASDKLRGSAYTSSDKITLQNSAGVVFEYADGKIYDVDGKKFAKNFDISSAFPLAQRIALSQQWTQDKIRFEVKGKQSDNSPYIVVDRTHWIGVRGNYEEIQEGSFNAM